MKKATIISLVLTAALLITASYLTGQDRFTMSAKDLQKFRKAKTFHYEGQQFFLKKKFSKARKAFEKCLELFPKYSSADYFLARIADMENNTEAAFRHIENAKTNYSYMNNLSMNSQTEYLDQLRQKRENLKKDLGNSEVRLDANSRSQMEQQIGKIDNILNKPFAVTNEIPADYHFLHGNIFFKKKKLKEAHDQYVEALRVDPTHTDTYNNIITLFFSYKQYINAMKYLEMAEANNASINPKLKEAVLKANGK